jgi:4-amino-4-deoxy-L-arabinose transferase-like glycosyltransferase
MRAEPERAGEREADPPTSRWCLPSVVLAAAVGVALMTDTAWRISATYDEVTYINVATTWWRTGRQDSIARMGSPLTFWKLQQAPVLWLLDRSGRRDLANDPVGRLAELLPLVRVGALWVWLSTLGLTAWWSCRLYGPRAMVLAAWLFALGPNLLAHGALVTMELPVTAASTAVFLFFWRYLEGGRRRDFWIAAALTGLAFSCKFTAVLLPAIVAAVWWVHRVRSGRRPFRAAIEVARGAVGFVAVMVVADIAVTGGALLPSSPRSGQRHPTVEARFGAAVQHILTRAIETPIPQDWVGFATQARLQKAGGPSYLLGQRRMRGWWYYYFVAMAVKVPLTVGLLLLIRCGTACRERWPEREALIPLAIGLFLLATALGSSRNYGLRYLLPLAPMAIVWMSALAEQTGWRRLVAWFGLLGPALGVAATHPDELTYFNVVAGGRLGGRAVLADSNLDWGQGLKSLARLQKARPELADVTIFYFGSIEPKRFGVAGTCHVIDAHDEHPGLPATFSASTPFVAVSASLQFGPWGPPGYFRALDGVRPCAMTDDTTIAVYRTADLPLPERRVQ